MRTAQCFLQHRWKALLILALISGSAVVLAQTPTGAVGVYYDGPNDIIKETLQRAAPYLVLVDQPELAQVLVVNGQAPSERSLDFMPLIQQGNVGLVLFCSPQYPQDVQDMGKLIGLSAFGIGKTTTSQAVNPADEVDSLQAALAWESAPAIQGRTVVSNPNLLRPVVATAANEPIIQRVRGRQTYQVFFVGAWLNHASNAEWQNWPYFPYLIYRLVAEAGDAPRWFTFANYPASPVPQGYTRWGILGGGIAIFLLIVGWFYRIQRNLYLNPQLSEIPPIPRQGNMKKWQSVGFHRTLSSLLFLISFYIPLCWILITYHAAILPTVLLPWSQTLAFWEQVTRWMALLWVLLDAGVGVAAIWYFARLKPHGPDGAMRYFQAYVWWQILSGALQLGVVAALATLFFPRTALAHLSYYFLIHTLIQFPGFLQVFRLFFRAVQRFDYEQILTLVSLGSSIVLQSIGVLLLRRWSTAHSNLSEALGAVLGLGFGLYLSEFLTFGIGLWLYQHLGYPIRALLLPQFDRHVLKRLLSFGGRATLGQLTVPLWTLLQILLFPGPWAKQNQHNVALYLLLIYEAVSLGLYNDLLPGLVEALSHNYHTLSRYYARQALHYGVWFSLFWFAGLAAVAEDILTYLLQDTPDLVIQWTLPILIWGALQWASRLPEQILLAGERPALHSWLQLGELGLRTGLSVLWVPYWSIAGLGMAYALSRALRTVVSWSLARRLVVCPRVNLWQSLIAPGAAALAVYNVALVARQLPWPATPFGSLLLCLFTLWLLLPGYGFITALLGGWDNEGLIELKQANRLCGGAAILLAGPLTLAVHVGARVSPLHGRFPVPVRKMAEEEARALTLAISHSNVIDNPESVTV